MAERCCSCCRQPLGADEVVMPNGQTAHRRCCLSALLARGDKTKALDAWERLRGKRRGCSAAAKWLGIQLHRPVSCEPSARGMVVACDRVIIELRAEPEGVVCLVQGRKSRLKDGGELVRVLISAGVEPAELPRVNGHRKHATG